MPRIKLLSGKTLLDFEVGDWSEYIWQDWYQKDFPGSRKEEHIQINRATGQLVVASLLMANTREDNRGVIDSMTTLDLNKAFLCIDSRKEGDITWKTFIYNHDGRYYLCVVRG